MSALSLTVDSLAEVRKAAGGAKGSSILSTPVTDETGTWAIQLYPFGEQKAADGYLSVHIKCLELAKGITGARISGEIRVLEGPNLRHVVALNPSVFLCPSKAQYAINAAHGVRNFAKVRSLPQQFVIEASYSVKEVSRGDSLVVAVPSYTDSRKQHPPGDPHSSEPYVDANGLSWTLCFFPNGAIDSDGDKVAVTVRLNEAPKGVSAVKVEGSVCIIRDDGKVVHTETMTRPVYVAHKGDIPGVPQHFGFPNFLERKGLPTSFTVSCKLTVKEKAHDTLEINVPSLKEIQEKYKKGNAASGPVYMHSDGSTWLLYLYPMGNSSAKDGYISLYAKVLSLPDSVRTVKFDGRLRVMGGDGETLFNKTFPLSQCLSPVDRAYASTGTWGFPNLLEHSVLPASLKIDASIKIMDMLRDDRLSWDVKTLPCLLAQYPRGKSFISYRYLDREGCQWCLRIYPQGTKDSAEDHIGLFVKLHELPEGVVAAKFTGSVNIVDGELNSLKRRAFAVSDWLSVNAKRTGTLADWGNRDFCGTSSLPPAFTVDCEMEVNDVLRTDKLTYEIKDLEALRKEFPRGLSTASYHYASEFNVHWQLVVYPSGPEDAKDGVLSAYVRPTWLPAGVMGVSFQGAIDALDANKKVIRSKSISATPFIGLDNAASELQGLDRSFKARELTSLPVTLSATLTVLDLLRDDRLSLCVSSFSAHALKTRDNYMAALRGDTFWHKATQSLLVLCVYPSGRAVAGPLSLYIRRLRRTASCLPTPHDNVASLPAPHELYLETATLTIKTADGSSTLVTKSIGASDFPSAVPDGDEVWGWTDFTPTEGSALPETFTMEVDISCSRTPVVSDATKRSSRKSHTSTPSTPPRTHTHTCAPSSSTTTLLLGEYTSKALVLPPHAPPLAPDSGCTDLSHMSGEPPSPATPPTTDTKIPASTLTTPTTPTHTPSTTTTPMALKAPPVTLVPDASAANTTTTTTASALPSRPRLNPAAQPFVPPQPTLGARSLSANGGTANGATTNNNNGQASGGGSSGTTAINAQQQRAGVVGGGSGGVGGGVGGGKGATTGAVVANGGNGQAVNSSGVAPVVEEKADPKAEEWRQRQEQLTLDELAAAIEAPEREEERKKLEKQRKKREKKKKRKGKGACGGQQEDLDDDDALFADKAPVAQQKGEDDGGASNESADEPGGVGHEECKGDGGNSNNAREDAATQGSDGSGEEGTVMISTDEGLSSNSSSNTSEADSSDVDENAQQLIITDEDLLGAPKSFECPISFQIMRDPVMAMDCHTYERTVIETWINKAEESGQPLRSPMTNDPMPPGLLANFTLRKSIEEFIDNKLEEKRAVSRRTRGNNSGSNNGVIASSSASNNNNNKPPHMS